MTITDKPTQVLWMGLQQPPAAALEAARAAGYREGLEAAAALMGEWADEAQGNIDARDGSCFNIPREVERDVCREAEQKIRALEDTP